MRISLSLVPTSALIALVASSVWAAAPVKAPSFEFRAYIDGKGYKGDDFKRLVKEGITFDLGTPVSCKFNHQHRNESLPVPGGDYQVEDLSIMCSVAGVELGTELVSCITGGRETSMHSFDIRKGERKIHLSFVCAIT